MVLREENHFSRKDSNTRCSAIKAGSSAVSVIDASIINWAVQLNAERNGTSENNSID